MKQEEEADGSTYCFGDFRFIPTRQLLLHHDVRTRVGSRALDLLHALVRRPGQLVTKDELIRFAWPNTFVQDENLKVNIAALRRALQTDASEHSYIATVPGRGYRFVAPLRILASSDETSVPDSVRRITGELPATSALIGRDNVIVDLAEHLLKARLLTIVGPAGVGKTSIGVTIARQIGEPLKDGVCFVDLTVIEDPHLVAPAIAFALGVHSNRTDILPGLVESVRGREMLLVLDNCEHVLSAVATAADYLSDALSKFMIVATSREPLRCRRESVYRLAPLLCPGERETAAGAASFPAVELLVRRAEAQGYRLKGADIHMLAAISRRLDGIPLAIELAAPRLSVKGPAELLGLLEESFDLLASPADAVTPRHTTLMATLDWSYRLLSEHESRLLRHLSLFSGTFALDNVVGVCGHLAAAEDLAVCLENLAARSLLSLSYDSGRRHYRLLHSTRSFASERLRYSGEQPAAMASYSRYLLSLFERAEDEWKWRTREDWTALYGYWGNDLRRVIDWSFGAGQDPQIGVRLTVAGITLWSELSSSSEHKARIGTALDAAGELPAGDRVLKLKLLAAQAINLCQSGDLETVVDLLRKVLALADELGDVEYRIRMTALLAGVQFFSGRYREALSTLAQTSPIIETSGARSAVPDIEWHGLMNRFCCGEVRLAYQGLTKLASEHAPIANRSQASRFVIDRFVAVRTFLALTAWTIGEPRQGFDVAQEAVEAAESFDHSVSQAFVLGLGAIPVSLMCGFLDVAQKQVTALFDYLALHQDDIWPPFARFYQATIDAAQGNTGGLERMRRSIDELVKGNLLVHLPMRLAMHADAALSHDQFDVARASVKQALEHAHRTGEHWCDAELRRLQGMIRWRERDFEGAERRLYEAIQLARQSGALSFELRATTSLAELGMMTGQSDVAMTQLAAILRRFDNSFSSADVMTARNLVQAHQPTRAQT
jgi:predicted ATPase/DNA-binding winged helix-turn-helix (wHTH) protein